jgi:hypothetical protein
MKSIRNSKGLYWGLIIAFFSLYVLVGFVSTLHSITFFELANTAWMAVLLGVTYELGQAAVLFSILMSDNNKKFLPWALMILLTGLQVTANVYASFKFMDSSGSNDWTFWQRSILFWMETDDPEMFKVVISWITGALLPVVALGMTALVAENLKMQEEHENGTPPSTPDPEPEETAKFDNKGGIEGAKVYDEPAVINEDTYFGPGPSNPDIMLDDESEWSDLLDIQEEEAMASKRSKLDMKHPENTKRFADELIKNQESWADDGIKGHSSPNVTMKADVVPAGPGSIDETLKAIYKDPEKPEMEVPIIDKTLFVSEPEVVVPENAPVELPTVPREITKQPEHHPRGWHLKNEFIDNNGDVYIKGEIQEGLKYEPPKKA